MNKVKFSLYAYGDNKGYLAKSTTTFERPYYTKDTEEAKRFSYVEDALYAAQRIALNSSKLQHRILHLRVFEITDEVVSVTRARREYHV